MIKLSPLEKILFLSANSDNEKVVILRRTFDRQIDAAIERRDGSSLSLLTNMLDNIFLTRTTAIQAVREMEEIL